MNFLNFYHRNFSECQPKKNKLIMFRIHLLYKHFSVFFIQCKNKRFELGTVEMVWISYTDLELSELGTAREPRKPEQSRAELFASQLGLVAPLLNTSSYTFALLFGSIFIIYELRKKWDRCKRRVFHLFSVFCNELNCFNIMNIGDQGSGIGMAIGKC